MKNLISMTNFVFEIGNLDETTHRENLAIIYNYANFLKQPLELWMFAPCKLVDGVWVVLEDTYSKQPDRSDYFNDEGGNPELYQHNMKLWREYQQAKERCLFDGFRIENFMLTNDVIGIGQALTLYSDIESLIYVFDGDIELTQTAIKQIGL